MVPLMTSWKPTNPVPVPGAVYVMVSANCAFAMTFPEPMLDAEAPSKLGFALAMPAVTPKPTVPQVTTAGVWLEKPGEHPVTPATSADVEELCASTLGAATNVKQAAIADRHRRSDRTPLR